MNWSTPLVTFDYFQVSLTAGHLMCIGIGASLGRHAVIWAGVKAVPAAIASGVSGAIGYLRPAKGKKKS